MSLGLSIIPFGDVDTKEIFHLAEELTFLPLDIDSHDPIAVPENAFNVKRNQYLSSSFLDIIKGLAKDKVLGVTNVDLYAPRLNFIFGQAEVNGKAAVISLFRLKFDADERKFKDRMVKEAVHELGHTFGLVHCSDPKCVMYFSNCLDDTDFKGKRYCEECKKLLRL